MLLGSLPTLKVIDVFNDVELGTKSLCKPQARFHKQSPSVPSATPRMRFVSDTCSYLNKNTGYTHDKVIQLSGRGPIY